MTDKTKSNSNAALFWVIGVIAVSMGLFVYLFISDAPKTVPKIKLSYFVDEQEIAESITKRLSQEMSFAKNYWVGVEPEKREQLGVALKLKNEIEKKAAFDKIFIDAELSLPAEAAQMFGTTETVAIKDNLFNFGEVLAGLEKQNKSYFVLTAAIYTTSMLKNNPVHKIKEKNNLKPMTFSFGYFSTTPEDENNNLFRCDTEDHSGIRDWACFVVSKSRGVRRKIESNNTKPWLGLMDLSGETDYVVILKKK